MAIRSLRLGLIGQTDVVEFHDAGSGRAVPLPVEYKRGKPKANDADRVQLCAQALCLEEMLNIDVPAGALYYGQIRRRRHVAFDKTLRRITEEGCERLHKMIATGITPRAIREPKCDQCSLIEICLPDALSPRRSAATYVERALHASISPNASSAEDK
jgi:CRISPR-associated exonuclease Cas4